jgi:hypothetical protein
LNSLAEAFGRCCSNNASSSPSTFHCGNRYSSPSRQSRLSPGAYSASSSAPLAINGKSETARKQSCIIDGASVICDDNVGQGTDGDHEIGCGSEETEAQVTRQEGSTGQEKASSHATHMEQCNHTRQEPNAGSDKSTRRPEGSPAALEKKVLDVPGEHLLEDTETVGSFARCDTQTTDTPPPTTPPAADSLPDMTEPASQHGRKRKRGSSVSRSSGRGTAPGQDTCLVRIAEMFGSMAQHKQVEETIEELYNSPNKHLSRHLSNPADRVYPLLGSGH